MAFRYLYFGVAASLALASSAGAGEKIAFSAPSSAWTVPQQERPEKETKPEAAAQHGPGDQFDALDAPSAYMAETPAFILVPGKAKDRYGSSASDADNNDPYAPESAAAQGEPSRLTNDWKMPRAWDSDPAKLTQQREEENRDGLATGSTRWDPLNPFAETDSRKDDHFGHRFEDSADSSFWQGSGHSPLGLEGMREGAFIPVNDDFKNLSEQTPNAALPGYDEPRSQAGMPDYTRSSSATTEPDNLDATMNAAYEANIHDPQMPGLVAPPRYIPPVQSYFGGRNEAPSAVLPWPKRPGDLFQ